MTAIAALSLAPKPRAAVYVVALLSNGISKMMSVIVPLWLITLQPSGLMIGLMIGARSLMAILFSIPGGALMDRIGARRVIIGFAVLGLATTPLYPLMPWIVAVMLLQVLNGFSETTVWNGIQTLMGQFMKGDHEFAGRLIFATRIGTLVGPLFSGFCWDLWGPWGGFGSTALWAAAMVAVSSRLPDFPLRSGPASEARPRLSAFDVMPRLADYREALILLLVPSIGTMAVVSMLNLGIASIQQSFQIVLFERSGYSGTLIGLLTGVVALAAAWGSLTVGRLTRRFSELTLLNIATIVPIGVMGLMPFVDALTGLAIVLAILGFAQGVGQPLTISMISKATDKDAQGKAVGLRATVNRITTTVLPIAMGAIADVVGLVASFPIVCGALLALSLWFWALSRRHWREAA